MAQFRLNLKRQNPLGVLYLANLRKPASSKMRDNIFEIGENTWHNRHEPSLSNSGFS
jgi:hypothetical protein